MINKTPLFLLEEEAPYSIDKKQWLERSI